MESSIKAKLVNKVLFILLLISFSSIMAAFRGGNSIEVRALFSWKSNEVTEGRSELFKTMEELNLNTLYQHFSNSLTQEDIESFLLDAEDKEIEVYFMDGNPKWASDKNGQNVIHTIDRVLKINRNLDKGKGIQSILFDIEPYLLEEWDEKNSKKIMNNFAKGMKRGYKKAKENNLKVILCIPYYYDTMGFTKELEELIKSGCDSIAIMNYYKNREGAHIKKEVELAHKYGKKVINIYELQAPGNHGLIDKNTYHKDGIMAVEKSFNNIQREHYGKNISIALHEYRAVKEVLQQEYIISHKDF